MKIALTALLMMSAFPAKAAEWWWIGTVGEPNAPVDQLLFADAERLTTTADWVEVTTRHYYYSGLKDGVFYIEANIQVNCPTKRFRGMQVADYSHEGKLLGRNLGGLWRDNRPGSLPWQIYLFACENDRPHNKPLAPRSDISTMAARMLQAGR